MLTCETCFSSVGLLNHDVNTYIFLTNGREQET